MVVAKVFLSVNSRCYGDLPRDLAIALADLQNPWAIFMGMVRIDSTEGNMTKRQRLDTYGLPTTSISVRMIYILWESFGTRLHRLSTHVARYTSMYELLPETSSRQIHPNMNANPHVTSANIYVSASKSRPPSFQYCTKRIGFCGHKDHSVWQMVDPCTVHFSHTSFSRSVPTLESRSLPSVQQDR